MFNLSSARVVPTLVAMICDISLNLVSLQCMLNLAVHCVMIYIMILIRKLNISTEPARASAHGARGRRHQW
jgi:hypothetical protein